MFTALWQLIQLLRKMDIREWYFTLRLWAREGETESMGWERVPSQVSSSLFSHMTTA